jgi:hypothetical protein
MKHFLLLAAFTFSLSSFGQGTRSAAPESYGTDMFKVHPELPGIIVQWFVSTLLIRPGTRLPTPWRLRQSSKKSNSEAASPTPPSN